MFIGRANFLFVQFETSAKYSIVFPFCVSHFVLHDHMFWNKPFDNYVLQISFIIFLYFLTMSVICFVVNLFFIYLRKNSLFMNVL